MVRYNGLDYTAWQTMPSDTMETYLREQGYGLGDRVRMFQRAEIFRRERGFVVEPGGVGTGGIAMPIQMKKGKKEKESVNMITRFLNRPLAHLVAREKGSKEGELFGMEFEFEGTKLHPGLVIPGWAGHQDGSLRGKSNVEWVFASPATYDISRKRVDRLFQAIKKSGGKFENSYRTSTHVHLNYSDKYGYQVVNMFMVYTILEDILTRWCGDLRSGNLFCLGARDAEDVVRTMENCILKYNNFVEFNNEVRYAGLNLCSLNKFGTIEFRTMRGVDDPKDALAWLEILNELYQYTLNTRESPAQIIEEVSQLGARGFMYEVFSKEVADRLIGTMTENDLHTSMYEGIRLVQMLAYTVSDHWNLSVEYKDPKVKMEDDKEAPKKEKAAPFPGVGLADGAVPPVQPDGRPRRETLAARARREVELAQFNAHQEARRRVGLNVRPVPANLLPPEQRG